MSESTWEHLLAEIEEAIKNGAMLPIAPEDRIFLGTNGEPNASRFADSFKKVWQAIPNQQRCEMRSFWNEQVAFGYPVLEYSNEWAPDGEGIYATKRNAWTIKFVASRLNEMPDDAIQFAIAHELAHVFQKTRGDTVHRSDDGGHYYMTLSGERRSVKENELDADLIAMTWGFSRFALERWEQQG